MEKHFKIFELLEKEFLTADEQKYLDDIIHSDTDSSRLISVYKNLKTELPNLVHLDTEIIGDYILYENNELPGDPVIPLLAEKIRSHLKNCLVCNEEYQILRDEFRDVGNHLERRFEKGEKPFDSKSILPSITNKKLSSFRYAVATIAVVAVIYFGLFFMSYITTPRYSQNIFSAKDNSLYVTRGRTSVSFQKGLNAADKGNYDEALIYFEEDIKKHSNESSIFYSYFITGLTYLKSAEKDFLGMFPSYDANKINHSIVYLNTSIEKNTTGNYDNLKLDAHYYLGRAYLLLENYDKAKEELDIVISSKGRFYNEAKELITMPEMN